jgi:hypothetical protein
LKYKAEDVDTGAKVSHCMLLSDMFLPNMPCALVKVHQPLSQLVALRLIV